MQTRQEKKTGKAKGRAALFGITCVVVWVLSRCMSSRELNVIVVVIASMVPWFLCI